jgi:amidophosphoribosyltransferase
MSDFIGHECGVAMLRLKHPLEWYQRVHGDPLWGLRRLYLLMEKQHNRGQDGAGVATVRFDMPPGEAFIERSRTAKRNPIERLFDEAMAPAERLELDLAKVPPLELKRRLPLLGEVSIGHLRYGTHGGRSTDACHPFLRRHNVASRNIAIAGNFNLTNAPQLFARLVEYGLDPVGDSDTMVVLEKMSYFLDREHDHLAAAAGPGSFRALEGRELAEEIAREIDLARVVRKACSLFDGGFVLAAILGHGDAFVARDPAGIRPAFMLETEEAVAVASERAALLTVFDAEPEAVAEVPPGHVLSIKRDGTVRCEPFADPVPVRQCTFERIYFSRGNDPQIYRERTRLGANLADRLVARIGPIERSVVGFIPNTAELAYLGLVEELGERVRRQAADEVARLVAEGRTDPASLQAALSGRVRTAKIAHKDQRLRTFITHDAARRDLVGHVYDVTRGVVGPEDTLVVVDDSIVRGTTLRESIVTMLARLRPARIVIASSAPPIMYPDCYGIDMSQLGRFIAFEAAVALLESRGLGGVLEEVERACLAQEHLAPERMENHVRRIYEPFTLAEIEMQVAALIRSPRLEKELGWTGAIELVYQSVEGLLEAMPGHTGTWYFTGDYPTPGGYRVLNTAYLNWRRRNDRRSY